MQYGAIDDHRPAGSYGVGGGLSEQMAQPQYSQSSLGGSGGGGMPVSSRAYPMEQDRFGPMVSSGGGQMGGGLGGASGLGGEMAMGNGANRGNAIGYPQTQSMGSSVGDGRTMGGFPASSHMAQSQDRGFSGVFGYGR